jgi:tetratricopeptide (TPR) repeat protein
MMVDNENSYSDYEPKMEFSDRVDEVAIVEAAIGDQDADKPNLLVFHGVGGQGKTRLCEKLRASLKSRDDVYVGRCTFDDRAVFEPQDILFDLRKDLGEGSPISFLAFDIGYVTYMQAAHPDRPLRSYADWFGRSEDVIREVIDVITSTPDSLFPGSGLIFRAAKWLKDKGLEKQARRTRPSINQLFALREFDIKPGKILKLLPNLLADDINYYLQGNSDKRLILMVDEYERLWPGQRSGERPDRVDKALYDLAALVPDVLWVFFSREPLHWLEERIWKDLRSGRQHKLSGLPINDAEELLRKEPIEPDSIRQAMLANASDPDKKRILPMLLELQIKEYFRILRDEKRQPRAEDFHLEAASFTERRRALYQLFIRGLGSDMVEMLLPLAVARRFNFELFRAMFPALGVATGTRFGRIKRFNFVEELSGDEWRFDYKLREVFLAEMDRESRLTTHQFLFEYFDAKAKPETFQTITPAHGHALSEALYHLSEYDPAGVVAWWEERSRPFSAAADYGTIISNLKRVVEIATTQGGVSTLERARLQHRLAVALRNQRHEGEAEVEYRKLLQTLEGAPDGSEEQVLRTSVLCGLARILIEQRYFSEANGVLEKADGLLFRDGLPREDLAASDVETKLLAAQVRAAQATLARACEMYAVADGLLREYLRFEQEAEGRWTWGISAARHELGKNLSALGRLSEAEAILSGCVEDCRMSYGAHSRNAWVSLHSLAQTLHDQGRVHAAYVLVNAANDAVDSVHSFAHHPWLSWGRETEAKLLRDLGRLDEAEALYREVIEEIEIGFGETHESVAVTNANLAVLLTRKGQLAEAEQLFRAALALLEENPFPLRARIGRIQNRYAELLIDAGRNEEAASLLERARENLEAVYGPDHFRVAKCLGNFARLAERYGEAAEAERFRRRIDEINRASSFVVRVRHREWEAAPEQDRTELLQRICVAPIEVSDLGEVTVERADLSDIYGERAELIRYTFTDISPRIQKFAVRYRDEHEILDGTSNPIHRMNNTLDLKISPDKVLRYLWFFCEAFLGGAGHKFLLCERPEDIDWRDDADAGQKEAVEGLLVSLKAEEEAGAKKDDSSDVETWLVPSSIVYAHIFSHVTFRVSSARRVDMIEEKQLQMNLAVASYMRGLPVGDVQDESPEQESEKESQSPPRA